jgi:hypothetical protein
VPFDCEDRRVAGHAAVAEGCHGER